MISPFIYSTNPMRVIFGQGRLGELANEAEKLGICRAMVLSTAEQSELAAKAKAMLGSLGATKFTGAVMHTPHDITDRALAELRAFGCDGLVALGGGSTVGLGKALALRTGLPLIAVPTTYAGSEMTPIIGETVDGVKKTQSDLAVQPRTVIYDVNLSRRLPVALSIVSGFNAIAHAVEALYARDANPVTMLFAEDGIRAFSSSLPVIAENPEDLPARGEAMYGAWLCGMCLAGAGMALHHKVCHVLGGSFGLAHAETHTVILPHALAYNAPAAPTAVAALQRALACADPSSALHRLAVSLNAPTSLASLGMSRDAVDQAVDLILRDSYFNPRPLDRVLLRNMLARAVSGEAPITE